MLGSAQVGLRFRSARLGWLGKESTYPLVQSFGSQHTAFDTLTWEDSETKSSTTRFHQNRLNRFYQPRARDSVRGLVRGSARFDSGSLFGLFLGSIHEDSARLCSRLVSVCSRPGSASLCLSQVWDQAQCGSARFAIWGSAHLGSWLGLGLGLGSGLGNQLNARLGPNRSSA